jgi:hypothetical protein
MGHATVLGASVGEALAVVTEIRRDLGGRG